jgi:hypothetical protein
MISGIIRYLLSNFTLTFFTIGVICAVVSISRHRKYRTAAWVVEKFMSYYCLWALGICSIYNAVMHIVFHQMAAAFIGWPDSPFQLEVGFASLGYGILGVLAFRKNPGLRLAVILGTSIFLWGAAAGHLYQISRYQNYAPGNAGVMLWTGIIQPVISLVLLCLSYISGRSVYTNTPVRKSYHTMSFHKSTY